MATKHNMLKKLDRLETLWDKLEYLNTMYLKASSEKEEKMIANMIQRIQNGY